MSQIQAHARSVNQLLTDAKYSIEYYQREYRWEIKQIEELLEDLTQTFLNQYDEQDERKQVAHYDHYFLGSIIVSIRDGKKYLIDGQQRLTSLTLLLIYLHHQQIKQNVASPSAVSSLIFSEQFGEKSFNLDIPERTACMEALYNGQPFQTDGQPESIVNLVGRYNDIESFFPAELRGKALPYFVDWLRFSVDLVEISAPSDEEAYAIFETMNDRGLRLNPTDMLKGYLLANMSNEHRDQANQLWKQRILEFLKVGKEEDADFFKNWLRARYANTIRERKKDAKNRDFEEIGAYHKWVRDNEQRVGLTTQSDYRQFVLTHFDRYSRHYQKMRAASQKLTPNLEYIYYNAFNNFTLQYPLMLAPINVDDHPATVEQKMRLVAGFIDIFVARRIVNFRTLSYSSIVYTMFNLMKDIRGLDVPMLSGVLKQRVCDMEETFDGVKDLYMHQQNRRYLHYLLARITQYIEQESGVPSTFEQYVTRNARNPFEVEHIWADKYQRHTDEFAGPNEFAAYRNRFGDLLLLPKSFNASFGDKPYAEKLPHYYGQNLLAKSLNDQCYQSNPGFLAFKHRSGLPFQAHDEYKKADIDARQELYRRICEEVWSPKRFDREVSA
jgi:hypothetical protein